MISYDQNGDSLGPDPANGFSTRTIYNTLQFLDYVSLYPLADYACSTTHSTGNNSASAFDQGLALLATGQTNNVPPYSKIVVTFDVGRCTTTDADNLFSYSAATVNPTPYPGYYIFQDGIAAGSGNTNLVNVAVWNLLFGGGAPPQ